MRFGINRLCSSQTIAIGAVAILALWSTAANAVPAFARQTGQNCVACHAGGQFPELTPYGRLFKLTGYTIGEKTQALSAMAVASYLKTRNTNDPNGDRRADFPKDGNVIFSTASLFYAGKLADKIGAFIQATYNNYDSQSETDSHWKGHGTSDNLDIRFADRFIGPDRDLILGATMNNNPSVQDVWNSAPAWGFNTVPGSAGPTATPLLAGGLAQQVAGFGAYAYMNQTVYAELSLYRTANGVWSFMSQGFNTDLGTQNILKGYSPYLRLALTHEWGAHNVMVGVTGLSASIYPDPVVPEGQTNRYRDIGIDAQYQYLLDPHAVTAQMAYIHEHIDWADSIASQAGAYDQANNGGVPTTQGVTNPSDTLNMFRAKASYVYGAKVGSSLAYFRVSGSSNTLNQTAVASSDPASPSVSGNLAGSPSTAGWTAEVFWLPIQFARVGLQYTMFSKFNGASGNYDGWGRSARDNNSLFVYVWAAY